MNRELKRISALVVVMFVTLFAASSIIQVFQVDALGADARNARARADEYKIQRGQILTSDGKAIVVSKKESADEYQFQRQYLDGKLYSAVTGYYPVNGEPTGIEGALDAKLAGTGSNQVFDRIQNIVTGQDPKGDSVELTIDPKVQKAAYDALGNKRGAVVAIDPSTGAVLAMVSKPSFDPNAIAVHDSSALKAYNSLLNQSPSPLTNRAIAGNLNPPGSTFKLIVSSAALESGKYTESSQFPSPTSLTLPGTSLVIQNSDGEVCGTGPEGHAEARAQPLLQHPLRRARRPAGSEGDRRPGREVRLRQAAVDPALRHALGVPEAGPGQGAARPDGLRPVRGPRHADADGHGLGRDRQRWCADEAEPREARRSAPPSTRWSR